MSSNGTKFRIGPVNYANATPGRCLLLSLLSVVLLTGCSTVTTYKSKMAAGPAKPAAYPVLVYTEDMTVPRPCEVIGTVTVGGSRFTMRGGSAESEMLKVMHAAREYGADAIQMKTIKEPDFSDANFRLTADLLRYTDQWETVAISEQQFANYLETNRRNRDPIEGAWNGREGAPLRIGIMRNTSKPGRDFIGFTLNTENPAWRKGYKKIDIQRGPRAGIYIFDYYLDDFSKRETTVILGKSMTFTLAIPTSDEETALITYSKNR